MQDKKTLVIVIVILVLALGLVTYWFLQRQSVEDFNQVVTPPGAELAPEQPSELPQQLPDQQLPEQGTGTGTQQPTPF